MENEVGATVDLHRTRPVVFGAVAAFVAGNAMLQSDDGGWGNNPSFEKFL
jgi:hypothetical protein